MTVQEFKRRLNEHASDKQVPDEIIDLLIPEFSEYKRRALTAEKKLDAIQASNKIKKQCEAFFNMDN